MSIKKLKKMIEGAEDRYEYVYPLEILKQLICDVGSNDEQIKKEWQDIKADLEHFIADLDRMIEQEEARKHIKFI